MLQQFIEQLDFNDKYSKVLFLKAIDLHSKTAGYYQPKLPDKQDTQHVIYVTAFDNDTAWQERARKQQRNLAMPKDNTDARTVSADT